MDLGFELPTDMIVNILFRDDIELLRKLDVDDSHLVHYTSAANAINIIRGKTMWLRNARLMNDFSEVQYGKWCVEGSLNRLSERWNKTLDFICPGLAAAAQERYNSLENHRVTHTFVLCLSEHLKNEDNLGRLSMWRAYGGDGGVAMVFDRSLFHQDPTGLDIYSTVVRYTDQDGYFEFLERIVEELYQASATLSKLSLDVLTDKIASFLHFAVLSTKHPAFAEEREVRLLAGVSTSEIAERSVEVVGGVPQVIWKLPLTDLPERSYTGDLKSVLKRIIVGPVIEPPIVNEALRIELAALGIENAERLVHTSWVPLRRPL